MGHHQWSALGDLKVEGRQIKACVECGLLDSPGIRARTNCPPWAPASEENATNSNPTQDGAEGEILKDLEMRVSNIVIHICEDRNGQAMRELVGLQFYLKELIQKREGSGRPPALPVSGLGGYRANP